MTRDEEDQWYEDMRTSAQGPHPERLFLPVKWVILMAVVVLVSIAVITEVLT